MRTNTLIWAHFTNMKSIWCLYSLLKSHTAVRMPCSNVFHQINIDSCPSHQKRPLLLIFSSKRHIKLIFASIHSYRQATATEIRISRNAYLNDALVCNIMWKQLQKNHQMFCPSRDIINGAYILQFQMGLFFSRLVWMLSSYSHMSRSIYEPWIRITILLSRSTI